MVVQRICDVAGERSGYEIKYGSLLLLHSIGMLRLL
jgi:hypothetical protein